MARRRYTALSDNPDEALVLFPEVPRPGGVDEQQAQLAFTVLMSLQPFSEPEGVNHVVMATVLMGMTQKTLQQVEGMVEQPQGLALAAERLAGASNVLAHTQGEIEKVMQMKELQGMEKVGRQLAMQWKQLEGQVQQLAKAVQAAEQQAQPQVDGEQAKLQAKLQEMQLTGEAQRKIAAESAQQKMQQKQISWSEENQRRNATVATEAQRKLMLTQTEMAAKHLTTRQDLMHAQAEHELEQQQAASKGSE